MPCEGGTACDQDRRVLWLSCFHFGDLKFVNKTFNELIFCETEVGVQSVGVQSVLLSRQFGYNVIEVQLKAVCVRRIFFICVLAVT